MNQFQLLILLLVFPLNKLDLLNAHRVRRRVVFNQNSKFFIRLNGKTNVLNATGIFAHGWTIRINYDLPDTIPKINRIFKRDVGPPREEDKFSTLATSCVSNHICQFFTTSQNNTDCGFFCEIRNIIMSSSGPKAGFLKSYLENCHLSSQECLMQSQNFDVGT
ncbi:uncharacterized protein LOC123682663 [Harmonia axyridis]|uniref:uncharacterized protein LOC123682663 n=1 Tax=Harmonia axyridis TaxID=115357 RepID=UPI001E275181|nr:uncharacterized protein LOC123682663 [Harmonia axyridis]